MTINLQKQHEHILHIFFRFSSVTSQVDEDDRTDVTVTPVKTARNAEGATSPVVSKLSSDEERADSGYFFNRDSATVDQALLQGRSPTASERSVLLLK